MLLYIVVPVAFLGLSFIFLIIDLIKEKTLNFKFNTKEGTLNCLSLAIAVFMTPLLFKGMRCNGKTRQ